MKNIWKLSLFMLAMNITKTSVEAQNLVPNYSFEDTLHCPIGLGDLTATQFWYSPTYGSPDYFHSCDITNFVGVPVNYFGYQYANTGNAYAGWGVTYDSVQLNWREYLQVSLIYPLTAGKKYIVTAYMINADSFPMVLKNIGIALSNGPIGGNYLTPIPFTPQIIYSQFLIDTGWVKVTDTVIASGGEQYLTIGYFNYNNSSDTMSLFYNPVNDKIAYYFVDDVSVIEDTTTGINENQQGQGIKIYSSNGVISIQINIPAEMKVTVYNMIGQIIINKTIKPFGRSTINLSEQPGGIYLLKLNSGNSITTKKIFITH